MTPRLRKNVDNVAARIRRLSAIVKDGRARSLIDQSQLFCTPYVGAVLQIARCEERMTRKDAGAGADPPGQAPSDRLHPASPTSPWSMII
jgi:hypothetical protein